MYTTQDTPSPSRFYLRGYHPLWHFFPENFDWSSLGINRSLITPHFFYISAKDSVCSNPLSLADIYGISIDFFSSRY